MNEVADHEQFVSCRSTAELVEILERLSLVDARLVGVTLLAPVMPTEQLFVSAPDDSAVLWSAQPGIVEVGLGAAQDLHSLRATQLRRIVHQTDSVLGSYQGFGLGARAVEPKFFGGMSFDTLAAPDGIWDDFRAEAFSLPRYLYRSNATQASITLFALRAELESSQRRVSLATRLHDLLATRTERFGLSQQVMAKPTQWHQHPNRPTWSRHVSEACRNLESGRLEKVVLARKLCIEFDKQPAVSLVLSNLLARRDGSVCFALRHGGSTFLGATPERLVTKRGPEISTEALAGSAETSNTIALDALMNSTKDRLEHELVVRDIVARMAAIGIELAVPPQPEIREFGPLVHLRTLLTAKKLGAPHVLALCRQLHPTPAVGGIPATDALEFIRNHEPFERGRYASPVGWFDGEGNGEWVVALRSGLIRGRSVHLFAGAGLVVGSQIESEWQETELKFRSFLQALGLDTEPSVPKTSSQPKS